MLYGIPARHHAAAIVAASAWIIIFVTSSHITTALSNDYAAKKGNFKKFVNKHIEQFYFLSIPLNNDILVDARYDRGYYAATNHEENRPCDYLFLSRSL